MAYPRLFVAASLGLLAHSVPAQAPRDALLLLAGQDTIAIERFARTSDRLESEMLVRAQNVRITFTATLRQDGTVSRVVNEYRGGALERSAPPLQAVTITMRDDSAIAEITAPTPSVQRLHAAPGAIPFINPSFAILELVLNRARIIGGDSVSVPGFAVAGGATFAFAVHRFGVNLRGVDSVVVTIGAVATRLAVSPRGEILGGTVPAQGLRIERVRGLPESGMKSAPTDYSAPPGAPYRAEEVSVRAKEGFSLSGTLTIPSAHSGPLPAVVMITGSGQEDRDEAIPGVSGYRPFRQIADTLSRNGVAVLRLDDRGVGGSGGDVRTATSANFADDVKAALAFLRSRQDIDGRRLGLIGHSEGGLIAPMIAADDTTLRGIVLMAGPAWTGRKIIEYQNRYALSQASTYSPAQRDSILRLAMRSVDSLAAATPWLGFFMTHDPLPVAKRVKVPVLILQGETDRQVTAEQASELAAAFKAGGNHDVTLRVFPRANHLFVDDPSGNPQGYATLPVHVVRSDVLAAIVDWVRARIAFP